ncbi:putative gamma-glutamyl phosphate reductase [Phaeomoniella chlamydospora]|uniref:glutamate-5-semialdehyde dehydrogenase n=1 Tax=Phaeomoniella chlamydospora TaxID=158046 RepID=A0A0G2DX16_PHACM|nr:putative gamma-glutamyl phosphate reductase [Phaeomoniella chlamydospora]
MSLTESSPVEAAKQASIASRTLATLSTEKRNEALAALHDALLREKPTILEANRLDLEAAKKATENGELRQSTFKRLDLTRPGKYEDMLRGILDVRELEDPIGKVTLRTELDDGLELERVSCPIGVLLIIFEARPEVIANIASLAIKSGNAAILKGGKESTQSFQAISNVISRTLSETAVPNAAIQLVKTRDVIDQLLGLDQYIDLVIPRGGNELVKYCKDHTKIPVLGHADGLCAIYVHSDADPAIAVPILADSKCGYPAACNAVETLLVHQDSLTTVLPPIATDLLSRGVSLRCDAASKAALSSALPASSAALLQDSTESDYSTEFLDLILAIKTIPSTFGEIAAVDAAISHINAHSSHHTDVILTTSKDLADRFFASVDSAGVYWNASTRFADGMRYGFGTEVGISTNKIHSRGPVGLEGLTIYKYLIRGSGQTAVMYGEGARVYKHKKLGF